MADKLTDVIAERTLEATKADADNVTEVQVRFGRPVPDPDPQGDWICPVQILGLNDEAVADVHGVDAVQAFMLALQKVGIDLAVAERSGLELRWLGGRDLGFPVKIPSRPWPSPSE